MCMVLTLVFTLVVFSRGEFHAFSGEDLNLKEICALGQARDYGEEVAVAYIDECNTIHPGSIRKEAIEFMIKEDGLFVGYIEEVRNKGYISSDFKLSSGSTNSQQTTTQTPPTEPAKTPEPFTVEAYNPSKTMWATQIVNCREGASTEYNKVGSLTEDEEVSVTGMASTGWYQITREDGTIVYVSEKYLTEKEPAKEEMVTETVSEATEESQIKEEEATPEPPEPTLEPMPEQTATPEPTIEPTMEPRQESTAVPTMEPTVDDTTIKRDSSTPYIVAGIIGILVIVGTVVAVKRKRK